MLFDIERRLVARFSTAGIILNQIRAGLKPILLNVFHVPVMIRSIENRIRRHRCGIGRNGLCRSVSLRAGRRIRPGH